MNDGDYFAPAFVSKADRIRAGQRDSRIAAADTVARADRDVTVAVLQGASQGRGRDTPAVRHTKRRKPRTRAVVALAAMLLLVTSGCAGHCESQDEPGSRWCIGGT